MFILGLSPHAALGADAQPVVDWEKYATPKADKIVVYKSQRVLELLRGDKVLRRYHVSLGPHPVGQKQAAGDGRTPEGSYVIDWRNIFSQYHVALHISYPNGGDVKRSTTEGGQPGGAIMIHGEPNYLTDEGRKWLKPDWTAGCIALKNPEIDEIWRLVDDGTPIVIYP